MWKRIDHKAGGPNTYVAEAPGGLIYKVITFPGAVSLVFVPTIDHTAIFKRMQEV